MPYFIGINERGESRKAGNHGTRYSGSSPSRTGHFLAGEVGSFEKDVQAQFDRIETKLDEAIKGRPTWAMVFLLTGLMTACSGMTVFILAKSVSYTHLRAHETRHDLV